MCIGKEASKEMTQHAVVLKIYCSVIPLPRLPALTPRGLDTLGLVPPGVLVLPVVPPPLSDWLDELGGPHGLGRGSRFSVLDGWAPGSEVPPRAEKGLLPNYRKKDQAVNSVNNTGRITLTTVVKYEKAELSEIRIS